MFSYTFLYFQGSFSYWGYITFILAAYALAAGKLFKKMHKMKSASRYKPNAAFGGFLAVIGLLVYVAADKIGWLALEGWSFILALLFAYPFFAMALWHFGADYFSESMKKKDVRIWLGILLVWGAAVWIFILTHS